MTRILSAAWVALLVLSHTHAAPSTQGSIQIRLTAEPATLDWNRASTPAETMVLMNLMEGLVELDSSFVAKPRLAQSFRVSSDGLTYTFKLKAGIEWSDGVALEAKHFVDSWRRLLSPLTAASYAYLLFDIEGAREFSDGKLKDFSKVGIKAVDAATLEVKLERPVSHFVQMMSFWVTFPIREELIQKHAQAWTQPGNLVTLGPYILASRDLDSKIVLAPNPKYKSPRGNLKEITLRIVKEESTALKLYESGALDIVTDLGVVEATKLKTRVDFKEFPYLRTHYLGFRVSKHPVSDLLVRQAIARSIDRPILAKLVGGGAKPTTSLLPEALRSGGSALNLKNPYPLDTKRARSEFTRSGVAVSPKPKLELVFSSGERSLLMAQALQHALGEALPVEVVLQPFDSRTYRAQIDLGIFPMFLGSWAADFPEPDNFFSVFLGESGNNKTGWKSAAFDELVLKARAEKSKAKREQWLSQAQKLLIEKDVVIVPLFEQPSQALIRPSVVGYQIDPLNYVFLRKVSRN